MKLKVIDARSLTAARASGTGRRHTTNDGGIWVGDAPGGGAYLEGRFETEARS